MAPKKILFVVFLAGVAPFASVSLETQPSIDNADTSRAPIKLIAGSNSQVEDLVKQNAPDLLANPAYPLIQATSVFITNNRFAILSALTVKWTLAKKDGTKLTAFTTVFPERDANEMTELPLGIPSGGVVLVSPFTYAIHGPGMSTYVAAKRVIDAYSMKAGIIARTMNDVASLTARVDAVIFRNGIELGPDQNHLAKQYVCEMRGEIDEATILKMAMNKGGPVNETLSSEMSTLSSASDETDDCSSARFRAASRFSGFFQRFGSAALDRVVSRLSKEAYPALRRPSGQMISAGIE